MPLLRHLARTPLPTRPFQHNVRPFQLNAGAVRVHISVSKPKSPRPHHIRAHFHTLLRSTTALGLQSDHRPSVLARRQFHSTPRREAIPFLGLAGLLKASTILEVIRAVGRITLTFVPIVLITNKFSKKYLKKVDWYQATHPGQPNPFWKDEAQFAAKRERLVKNIRVRTIVFHALMFAPFALFALAIAASIERTPLTGRWRTILLSPEEEESISQQLAGSGWYRAVGEILAREGAPRLVAPSDWRYQWVNSTLRQLESIIPALGEEENLAPEWYTRGDDDVPLPPPAEYPLRPRPRASEAIRLFRCSVTGEENVPGVSSHHIPGPPYSLIVIDDPDSCNAFSYGFGPEGAGGVVVFSGFLDRIMADHPTPPHPEQPSQSWWTSLLGGSAPARVPPTPTPEQTADLAVLLSHELSHLMLAHHLETLSSMTVLIPGVWSIVSDVLRSVLFPVTALFGPFVNDALATLGANGSIEIAKCGDYCTTMHQEIEADVVSARILAYAGFDPRRAVQFWESRDDQCVPGGNASVQEERERRQKAYAAHAASDKMTMGLFGASHPINEVRGQRLREELGRWQAERVRYLEQMRRQRS